MPDMRSMGGRCQAEPVAAVRSRAGDRAPRRGGRSGRPGAPRRARAGAGIAITPAAAKKSSGASTRPAAIGRHRRWHVCGEVDRERDRDRRLAGRGRVRARETLVDRQAVEAASSAAVQRGRAMGARIGATQGGAGRPAFVEQHDRELAFEQRSAGTAAGFREGRPRSGADVSSDPRETPAQERSACPRARRGSRRSAEPPPILG